MKYRAAGNQRRIDRKKRIFSSGTDENQYPSLDIIQQDILLCTIKTVNFIDKKHRPRPVHCESVASTPDNLPNIPDAGRRGAEIVKFSLRVVRNHRRQRGLADSGRTVKYQTTEPVGLEHPCQQLIGPKKMPLSDKFIKIPRPHPSRQRRR